LISSLYCPPPHPPLPSFPTRRSSDLVYRITGISADTLTLANGSVIFAEGPESISIGRGKAPDVADIKISQVSPFKVNTSGTINIDRKSTRLNSSHDQISYAVFCLKKK